MVFIKKHAWVIAAVCIVVLYFFSRLYNILSLPIFTDEAIYVRWSQIAANDASWRFISLTDGKQPLFVWIAMILMKLFDDPLLAGRLVSVLSGFLSMIGIFFLTNEVFKNRKISLLACLLLALYPFSLVYDRLALYESLVSVFIIWSVYFEILLVKHLRLDIAMILGMIVGTGMLTKTNANFALILLPLSLILFDFKDKKWKEKIGKWIVFSIVASVIAFTMYSVLRLSPFYHIIKEKNYLFIYPLNEWLQHPFTYFFNNLSAMMSWLVGYATIPFLLLVISAFFVGKKFIKESSLLFSWFIFQFLLLALFGKLLYPRWLLPMTMSLIPLGAYGLYHIMLFAKKSWLKVIIFFIFISMFLIKDFYILTNFSKADIPKSDKGQFINGWPGGIGVRESIEFFKKESRDKKIYIGTEGTFGLMPFALEIYLVNNPNVTIKGFWPIEDQAPEEALEAAKNVPTYFIFYQDCVPCQATGVAPRQWQVKEIMKFSRKDKNSYYTVYQIL